MKTLNFGKERRQLADWINENDLKCYSDDAGLNVLLEKPMVIYPYVQHLLFLSGYLDKKSFYEKIRQMEIDLIILTGCKWSWQGVSQFPKDFMPFVRRYYKPINSNINSKYKILIPKFKQGVISFSQKESISNY